MKPRRAVGSGTGEGDAEGDAEAEADGLTLADGDAPLGDGLPPLGVGEPADAEGDALPLGDALVEGEADGAGVDGRAEGTGSLGPGVSSERQSYAARVAPWKKRKPMISTPASAMPPMISPR